MYLCICVYSHNILGLYLNKYREWTKYWYFCFAIVYLVAKEMRFLIVQPGISFPRVFKS